MDRRSAIVGIGASLTSQPFVGRSNVTARVELETDAGVIAIDLFGAHAPITVANFISNVDSELYTGASFYRVVRPDNDRGFAKITIVQGGVAPNSSPFPAIRLETTKETGLTHLDGTVSMARAGANTATSEFFVCLGRNQELDFGGRRNADGLGFAAFGNVSKGMDVVRQIYAGSTQDPTGQIGVSDQQMLRRPVHIITARCV